MKEEASKNVTRIEDLEAQLRKLNVGGAGSSSKPATAPVSKPAAPSTDKDSDDDDGVDLFGSEDEEESAEAAKIREQRLAEYAAKKGKSKFLLLLFELSFFFDIYLFFFIL